MENLNAEQIKKDLKELMYEAYASNGAHKPYLTMRDALALITSQEQRIKELTEENERLRAENAKYEAENHAEFNKWLKLEEATKRHHSELFEDAKIAVKEETVRKMQERFQAYFGTYVLGYKIPLTEALKAVDQIAKEMLEGEK